MTSRLEGELSLSDVLAIAKRRRNVIVGVVLAALSTCALYCLLCARKYEAIGTLQIQKSGSDAMGLDTLMGNSGDAPGGLDADIDLKTQATILESDTIALKTIEGLGLQDSAELNPAWDPIARALSIFSPKGPGDPASSSLENSPGKRQRVLSVFHRRLKVDPVTGTRLIQISFLSLNRQTAAAVVNRVMQSLVDYNFQTRYAATSAASEWLNSQLGDLRKQTELLQGQVVNLQRDSGVYSFGATDESGKEQIYSLLLDELKQATGTLESARQNLIVRGAIARAARSGNAELLSGLAGSSGGGLSGPASSSLAVIQELREKQSEEEADLDQAQVKFGKSYPKLAELRARVVSTDHAIQDEVHRVAQRANSDLLIATQVEENAQREYNDLKSRANQMNDKAIQYAIVRQEADDSRQLYVDLLKRLKEAGVLEGLKSSNITVVDPGRVPASPKVPRIPLYMTLALMGGLLVGCFMAYVVHSMDNKIHGPHELEELLHKSLLGVTPQFTLSVPTRRRASIGGNLIALLEPQSTFTEGLRSVRTSMLLAKGNSAPKIILVTSSISGEGKTLFSANLAAVLAYAGGRVLLVDTDMRRSTLGRVLGLSDKLGVSALLSGQVTEPNIQEVRAIPGLHVLLAGLVPPNPSELLGSASMKKWLDVWREAYNFVILDAPPVLPVTDATVLNGLSEMSILIVRSNKVERAQVVRSHQVLLESSDHYVGVVLNGMDPTDHSYYGYHGYSGYRAEAYGELEAGDA